MNVSIGRCSSGERENPILTQDAILSFRSRLRWTKWPLRAKQSRSKQLRLLLSRVSGIKRSRSLTNACAVITEGKTTRWSSVNCWSSHTQIMWLFYFKWTNECPVLGERYLGCPKTVSIRQSLVWLTVSRIWRSKYFSPKNKKATCEARVCHFLKVISKEISEKKIPAFEFSSHIWIQSVLWSKQLFFLKP